MNMKDLSERDICSKFISPAVKAAGWDEMTQIREEVSFTKGRILVRGKLVTRGKSKRADYILYYKPNIPIAIIECPTNFNRMTVAWYLNHSERPNTKCDDDLNFSALRNINRGEELTVNYSTYSERPGAWVEPWWPAKREVHTSRPARVRRRRR